MFNDFWGFDLDELVKYWCRPVVEVNGYRVIDIKDGILVLVNAIGIDKKDLKLELENNKLKVYGKTELKEIDKISEVNYTFKINPQKIDRIDYELKNGYLYIYLIAKEAPKPDIKINYKN